VINGQVADPRHARDQLILQYIPLVHKVALSMKSRRAHKDDLVQSGIIGLIRGVDSFDSGKGVALTTHLHNYIRWEIIRFIDGQNNRQAMKRIQAAWRGKAADSAPEVTFVSGQNFDVMEAPDWAEIEEQMINRIHVAQLLGRLSDREKYCVVRHFIDDISPGKIGKEVGVTRQRVTQIIDAALKKMRRDEVSQPKKKAPDPAVTGARKTHRQVA
jgi:RNA polymerase sporulation-specific sigma factor